MVSVSPLNSFIFPRCLHSLSRQQRSLSFQRGARQQQSAHASQTALSNARTEAEKKGSRLNIKKHWNTDFRGPFKLTWASRSALHVNAKGEEEKKRVALSPTRPVGLIRGGRQRRRDGIVRETPRPLEAPRLPGSGVMRAKRKLGYSDALQEEEYVEHVPSIPSRIPRNQNRTPRSRRKDSDDWELVPSTPSWLKKEEEQVESVQSIPSRVPQNQTRSPRSPRKDDDGWELVPSTPSWLKKEEVPKPLPPQQEDKGVGETTPSPLTPPTPQPNPPPSSPPPIFAAESPSIHTRLSRTSREEDLSWYWETFPPSIAEKSRANHFFTKSGPAAKILTSAGRFMHVPQSDVPEVAFVGRSNVGKSSLLNAIVNADIKALLARTSARPGFTKTMNFYGLGPGNGVVLKQMPGGKHKILGHGGLTIVDMPGYGKGSLTAWGVEIMKYIQSRAQLRRVFVLLDAQLGVTDKDKSLLASLRLTGVSHQVIISKIDKVYIPPAREIKRYDGKALERLRSKGVLEDVDRVFDKVRKNIQPAVGGGALGEILACSAETRVDGKRMGIDHVRYAVLKAVGLDGAVGSFKGDAFARKTIEQTG